MNNFLKETKKLLTLKNKLCFVMGNESCDLDSAISSICLAYFYSKHRAINSHTATTLRDEKMIPLFNISRMNLPLKTEITYFFKKNNIELGQVICCDEVQLDLLKISKYVLVDHFTPKYNYNVIEIIDHHPFDETIMEHLPKDCKLTIDPVGSCSTLIGDKIFKYFDNKSNPIIKNSSSSSSSSSRSCSSIEDNKEILKLLYGPIVLDTVNFSKDADKARPLDFEICKKIENLYNITETERKILFDNLVKARSDVSTLNALQILSKDLKTVWNDALNESVAIPGFPILVQDYIQLPNAEENLLTFANINHCDVIVLMGMKISNDNVQRDLGIINIKNFKLYENIINTLQSASDPDLKLTEYRNCKFLNGKFFQQINIRPSRKQILPMIKKVLN